MGAVRNVLPVKIANSSLVAKASEKLQSEIEDELKNPGPELTLGELANHQKDKGDTRGLKKKLVKDSPKDKDEELFREIESLKPLDFKGKANE